MKIRRFFYAFNGLTFVVMAFFAIYTSVKNYNRISIVNSHIEAKQHWYLDKYKKLVIFVLKNGLPATRDYFISLSNLTYNLPVIEDFRYYENKYSSVVGGLLNREDVQVLSECHKSRCIQLLVNKRKILDSVLKDQLGWYDSVVSFPCGKIRALQVGFGMFLDAYSGFVISALLYLFIFYLVQAMFLWVRYSKLIRNLHVLQATATIKQSEYTKKSLECDILRESLTFAQDKVNEYFTHHVHGMLVRDVCVEKVDIPELIWSLKKFLGQQLIKHQITVVLDNEDEVRSVKTDYEMIFIVLLNMIYKAVFRAKLASTVTINLCRIANSINIEINDVGYKYEPKLHAKVRIVELSKPILEKLYQKLRIQVTETHNNDVNTILVVVPNDLTIKKDNDAIENRGNVIDFKVIKHHS